MRSCPLRSSLLGKALVQMSALLMRVHLKSRSQKNTIPTPTCWLFDTKGDNLPGQTRLRMHLGLAAPKLLCDPRLGAHELLSRLHEDPDALLSFSELGAAQADGIVLGHKISWYGAGLCGWSGD